MALGGLVLGSPILYLKGTRLMMFQLSGFQGVGFTVEARKLEHGFRRIGAGIPYTLI